MYFNKSMYTVSDICGIIYIIQIFELFIIFELDNLFDIAIQH